MRHGRILLVLGLACVIFAGSQSLARAEDKPSPEAKQARDKFAKLLLPNGSQKPAEKTAKPTSKHRGVVVNAFGSTRVRLP
jgi:hypothetical protein